MEEHSILKKSILTLSAILVILAVLEVCASTLLFYKYKNHVTELRNFPRSSLLLVTKKFLVNGLSKPMVQDRMKSNPSPLYVYDSIQGYAVKPGVYEISYLKPMEPESKPFTFRATILDDGSRFVGESRPEQGKDTSHIQIYGDSFIFGEGVNDEQTFSYHLQQSYPTRDVRLFAAGGYSLTNSYMDFQKTRKRLNENDIVILGYADFYGGRHVAAPKNIRGHSKFKRVYSKRPYHLKFDLDDSGKLTIGYVPMFCDESDNYCQGKDPARPHMDSVSAMIINEIAKQTKAKVYLLYMRGSKSDYLFSLLDKSVTIVSALKEDFNHEVHDTVMDYDLHPGPYWHHAIFMLLKERIDNHINPGQGRP